jgi:parallel beta-helix repeat protein
MTGVYTNACKACDVLDVPNSGTKTNFIVYTNYRKQHPVISFNGWAGISIANGVSYIKINGFEVVGGNAKITLAKALAQPMGCANKRGTFDPLYNGNAIVIQARGARHSHHIVISNNIVHDCGGGGIGASHADYITVDGNTVYNTSWYTVFGTSGIAFYQFWNADNGRGYHNVISGNKCYNNKSLVPWRKNCELSDGNGIIIDDFRNRQNGSKLGAYRARTLIQNNVSWFNGGTGIHTFQSDHVDIINNTAYCNSRTRGLNSGQILSGLSDDNKIVNNIMVADSSIVINSNYFNSHLNYQNNLHYNLTFPGKEKINVSTSSCLNGLNPQFVMPSNSLHANFELKSNSPAIHRGKINIYSRVDISGVKRAQGHPPDIGAYESP